MPEPKYQNGATITSVTALEKQLEKNDYFRFRDKTVPKGQILNLTYRQLRIALLKGEICLAKPVKK